MTDAASTMFPDQVPTAPAAPTPTVAAKTQPVPLGMTRQEAGDRANQKLAQQTRRMLDTSDDSAQAEPQPAPAAAAPAPAARQSTTQDDGLTPPAAVAQARKANQTIEDRMFAGTPINLGADDLFDDGASQAHIDAANAETGRVLVNDFALPATDAKETLNVLREARANPPTAAQLGEMSRDAYKRVQEKYGKSANQVLNDAKRLIARDPRVVRVLNETGMGNHPAIVMKACESALRLKAAGKFK
jgi:hypothetical protein